MQHPDNLYLPRLGQVDQRVGEARHDAFTGAGPNTRPELQVKGGDFLGLGQDGIYRPVGNRLAGFFQVVSFDGLDVDWGGAEPGFGP